MALLTAKQDPAVVFADIDSSNSASTSAINSYSLISSSEATVSIKSVSGSDFTLKIFGTNLPASLSNPGPGALLSRIGKVTLVRQDAPGVVLFSWDGQGATVSLLSLGQAVQGGNSAAILNLFLGGTDTLQAEYENVDIQALPQLENVTLTGQNLNLTGNGAGNVLQGNSLDNVIRCGAGNDEARGFDGNDSLFGDDGDDKLLGGKGDDKLFAGLLNDQLLGEAGNDAARGGNGRDTLIGGSGRDELWGDFGRNVFGDNNDSESDLLVIKADQLLVNPLFGNIDSSGGGRCDLIGKIDAIDRVIIQGAETAALTFQQGYSWTPPGGAASFTGIAIFAAGKLEALYTGGDLNADQLASITTGDASAAVLDNSKTFYGTW